MARTALDRPPADSHVPALTMQVRRGGDMRN